MEDSTKRRYVSNETRKKLINTVVAQGGKLSEICSILQINKRTAQRIIQTFHKDNREERLKTHGRVRIFGEQVENVVIDYVRGNADASLKEIQEHINKKTEELGISKVPSLTTLDRIKRRNKISHRRCHRPTEKDVSQKRK